MMDAESSELVYSPSVIPVLCSKARITHSETLVQGVNPGEHTAGTKLVLCRPDVHAALFISNSTSVDPLADRLISFIADIRFQKSLRPSSGITHYVDTNEQHSLSALEVSTAFGQVVPIDSNMAATTIKLWLYNGAGRTVAYTISAYSGVIPALTLEAATAASIGPGQTVPFVMPLDATRITALGILATGAVLDTTVKLSGEYLGKFPGGVLNPLRANLASPTLVDMAELSHVRVTGMQLLVTDLSPALVASGENITARINEDLMLHATATSDLETRIKRLPENMVWRSGPAKEGSYAWWLPDDINSYGHDARDLAGDLNVLVSIFNLPATGSVRVQATWEVEYYTKSQVVERSFTPYWSQEHLAMLAWLIRQPAVSANYSHEQFLRDLEKAASVFSKVLSGAKMAGEIALLVGLL